MEPVYVIGSGGREFALAEKFHREGRHVFAIPGNDGMQRAGYANVYSSSNMNIDEKFKFISGIVYPKSLIVVGPEDSLAAGIVNYLRNDGHLVFGPTKEASIVESSKCWSSEFMKRNGIPAPNFYNTQSRDDALDYVKRRKSPLVIKDDGLRHGKGVVVAHTLEEALPALKMSDRLNIQDLVDIDYELSAMAVVDVRNRKGRFSGDYRIMLYSMDHKRLYNGDNGPNTGGMGAVAPLKLPERIEKKIISDVMEKTIEGFVKEKIEFIGLLYPAIAVDRRGNVLVLEYNVRFGDPETQVVLNLMESSLHDYLMAATVGELHTMPPIRSRKGYSVIVNMTSNGYPKYPVTGLTIDGLEDDGQLMDRNITVVHSGTIAVDDIGKTVWRTAGGRVLGVLVGGADLPSTISETYSNVRKIHFPRNHHRDDIGQKALSLT